MSTRGSGRGRSRDRLKHECPQMQAKPKSAERMAQGVG